MWLWVFILSLSFGQQKRTLRRPFLLSLTRPEWS
jgi:hypothetical protein